MNRPDQVLKAWEQQKQIQQQGDPMLKLMQKLMKPQPKRSQTAAKPQKKKK
jgi:hypothetical protein